MIISCDECGGQVSDKARICPHCGAPQGKTAKQKAIAVVNCARQHVMTEENKEMAQHAVEGLENASVVFGKIVVLVGLAFVLLVPHGLLITMLAPSAYGHPQPAQIFWSRGVFLILPVTFCRPILACAKWAFGRSGAYGLGRFLTVVMWIFAICVPIANFEIGFGEAIVADAIGLIVSIVSIGSLHGHVKTLAVVRDEKHDEEQKTDNMEVEKASQPGIKNDESADTAPGDEEAMRELERIKEYAARRGERE